MATNSYIVQRECRKVQVAANTGKQRLLCLKTVKPYVLRLHPPLLQLGCCLRLWKKYRIIFYILIAIMHLVMVHSVLHKLYYIPRFYLYLGSCRMLSRTQSLVLFAAIQLSSFTCQLMLVKLLFITVQLKGELIIDWNLIVQQY